MNGLPVLIEHTLIAFAPGASRLVPVAMAPGELIANWRASESKERSAAQEHFIDLGANSSGRREIPPFCLPQSPAERYNSRYNQNLVIVRFLSISIGYKLRVAEGVPAP